jgi:Na+/melibiose symporter-like transporter
MGAVVLAGAALVLVESRPPDADRHFDLPGAALAAVGLFAVLVALSRGGAWGWTSAPTVAAFVLGGGALALFARHELRAEGPMIDLRLLRRRSLATANLAAMASSAALFGTLILLPFYLTAVLGFEPVQLAIGITPIAASFMVVAPLAGRAIAPVGSERLATAGFLVAAGGAVGMALSAGAQSYAAMLPWIIAFGVGLAASTSSITMTAIDRVPPARLGVASALPNISRYIGGALGAAVLGAVLHANLPGALEDALGRVGPAGRDLVADGFRSALLVAAAFLLVAAAAASRMPRLGAREPIPAATASAPLDAPVTR